MRVLWGKDEVSFTLKVKEWYQIKAALRVAANEKGNRLQKEEQKRIPLKNEQQIHSLKDQIESEVALIRKVDANIYEYEQAKQDKLDEVSKWEQSQARRPLPGSYGSAFK